MSAEIKLSNRGVQILQHLLQKAQPMLVYTVNGGQDEIARSFGMSRQAVAIRLKQLKKAGLVRTGRKFVDVTEKAVKYLKGQGKEAIVLAKIEPRYREKVYELVKSLPIERALRMSGDYDLAIIAEEKALNEIVAALNNAEGIREVEAFVSIGVIKE
ncbi:MAG: Lrp/AsnC family transcriptional regulator [Thermoproteus sp.]|nr:Lrp/AsnC family transcriptional regulator [Thermoproteus sp.]